MEKWWRMKLKGNEGDRKGFVGNVRADGESRRDFKWESNMNKCDFRKTSLVGK